LPSGQTETGDYGLRPANTTTTFFDETVTFPIPLAAEISGSKIVYTTGSATHCSGAGHADSGYLCIYSANHHSVGAPTVISFEGTIAAGTTGHFGFDLEWFASTADAYDVGSYSVTAP